MPTETLPDWSLSRDPFGRLVFTAADGTRHENVVPVRAFPVRAPESSVAIMSPEGRELAWIEQLADAPAAVRTVIDEELAGREFTPEILRIRSVSSFAAPSTWDVETDRGDASLVLRGEEFIRRLSQQTLLIADANGIHFLIRDLTALDRTSRKLLDRFL
ncbi:MAG TPA: DUF1854 domain-containing protein [Quisquiliibacterium sp.]|nr:MAG: DUF1854 domain-containing protein [Burkholderiaceae bacterium]HQN12445.1 DUF1854 domain-containing protein [Quisquiliibacterium sp.]